MSLEKQAVEYMKENKGYQRLIGEIISKYKKLGRLGGMIKLQNLSPEEQQILAGIDYKWYGKRECNVSVQAFVKHFDTGKFEGVDFLKVLAVYSGKKLVTHKAHQEDALMQQQQFVQGVGEKLHSEVVMSYWKYVWENKKGGYHSLLALYKEAPHTLDQVMQHMDETIDYMMNRSERYVPLVMVATQVSKDPHYYDFDTPAFKLLLYVLAYKQGVDYPTHTPQINALLYEEGFLRDELSTATICYNLQGYAQEESLGWERFWERSQPLQLMLYNLKNVTRITAPTSKVYVVENPTVFTQLLDKGIPDMSIVCTRGQLTTADLRLLDLLVQGGATLYYSGDFDPEGLQIAQSIKHRYQDQAVLWMYTIENYHKAKSTKSIADRIGKLGSITLVELEPLVVVMRQEQVAAYEEALVFDHHKI